LSDRCDIVLISGLHMTTGYRVAIPYASAFGVRAEIMRSAPSRPDMTRLIAPPR
jgi:hypothetical protein